MAADLIYSLSSRLPTAVRRLYRRFYIFPPGTSSTEIFSTALAFFSFFILLPLIFFNFKTAADYRRETASINSQLNLFEKKMGQYRKLEAEFSGLKEDLKLLEKALPDKLDTPALLNKLSTLFGKNLMMLKGVKLEKNNFLLLSLDFAGNYPMTVKTLQDLERDEQQFAMQSLLLRRPYSGATLEGSLRLKTYYYKE